MAQFVSTSAPAFPLTPRLPVFGWSTFGGKQAGDTPCLLDRPDVVYTTSGRASILLAMEELGVKRGDQVLMPTYHCPTMIAPVESLGAEVVFFPITQTGAPDLAWLARQDTTRVRVMLAAHYFGLPQPMGAVRQWCDQRGIALIEDCAHALFGQSEGRAIGSWGDVAIGSLTKFLPVPEGGCWLVNRDRIPAPELHRCGNVQHLKAGIDILDVGAQYQRLPGLNSALRASLALLRLLRRPTRPHGLGSPPATDLAAAAQAEAMDGFTIDSELAHRRLSAPSRWVSQAAPRGRNVALRRRNYRLFADALSSHNGMRPLLPDLPEHCAPYVFPLWVQTPDPGYSQLRAMQFPVSRWDRLWPSVPSLDGDAGIGWSHHMLQLACHQDLSPDDVARMARVVLSLYTSPLSIAPAVTHP